MPVISVPQAFNEDELYVDLRPITGHSLFLKCEGFNFAGSIKLKAATEMVETADRDGILAPDSILVESSSGNLGVALSMIAASKGYRFLCVTDSRCNLSTRMLMEALGSQVHIIAEPDPAAAFSARGSTTSARCVPPTSGTCGSTSTPTRATGRRTTAATAPAIARQFPRLDVLFVGAGTTGTLMGCARSSGSGTGRCGSIAVDAVGSVASAARLAAG